MLDQLLRLVLKRGCNSHREPLAVQTVTVIITTKNRKNDLLRAIASCLTQTLIPEILVIDDGSTDGTASLVKSEFPTVRLHREEASKGLIVQRNVGARMVESDIILSIDDDSEFVSRHTIAQTVKEFSGSSIGAIAIPFINVKQSDQVLKLAPNLVGTYVTDNFIGCAYAIRRDVFLKLGGFREFLFHQGEEEDFCIRMLDAGLVTRLGRADPIHHYESPKRDRRRMDIYGGRNKILFCWYNVPMPYFLFVLPSVCVTRCIIGFRGGYISNAWRGVARGLLDCIREFRKRRPVRSETYRLFRSLRRSGYLRLDGS